MSHIPQHLSDIVVPNDVMPARCVGETLLDVQCTCGNRLFEIYCPDAINREGDEMFPTFVKLGEHYFLVIKALCTTCGEEHLLLDADFHGWEGVVNHNDDDASLPRPTLIPWHCLTCDGVTHELTLSIISGGKEIFVSDTDGKLNPDLWSEAFWSFAIITKCHDCNRRTDPLVDYEAR